MIELIKWINSNLSNIDTEYKLKTWKYVNDGYATFEWLIK